MANIIDKVFRYMPFFSSVDGLLLMRNLEQRRLTRNWALEKTKAQPIKVELFVEVPSGFEPL